MKTIQPLNPMSSDDAPHQGDHAKQPPAQSTQPHNPPGNGATFMLPEQDRAARPGNNEALNLIRGKLDTLYAQEPDAKEEEAEVENLKRPSKHQKYMQQLSKSGRGLAEIQTAWHQYYASLPDREKHEVWQEFYSAHQQQSQYAKKAPKQAGHATHQAAHATQHHKLEQMHVGTVALDEPEPAHRAGHPKSTHRRTGQTRRISELKKELLGKVDNRSRAKLKARHHVQSLAFGLGMGAIVILILLFGFFNERFIAPFVTPSRNVSATPIIINPDSIATGTNPEVIIPKINVEIPVVYDVPTINEADVENGLERGVVHYATTPNPGEKGNAVVFGHSSNNILNPGKYKFAFVLLSRLDTGDVFYLQKDGKRYAYKVFEKKIVEPTDVSVLSPIDGKVATATLITCDPPGTSLHRLIVVGEQISPDPNANVASTATNTTSKPTELPSNSPSLWSRIVNWF